MDSLDNIRHIIEEILIEHTRVPFAYGDVKPITVFDRKNDHYLLFAIGWEGAKRVHGSIIHVEIRDNRIWIQQDGTEDGITDELVEQGISPAHIVLSFHRENLHPYTGLPVA